MAYVCQKLNVLPVFKQKVDTKDLEEDKELISLKLKFISVMSWSSDELNFEEDLEDLKVMSPSRKTLLACTLIFFKDGDRIIIDNCTAGFPTLFENNDIDMNFVSYKDRKNAIEWYGFQTANEKTHNISYNDAINCYYINDEEFRTLFNEIEPEMQKKILSLEDFVNKSIEDSDIININFDKIPEEEKNIIIAKNMLNFILVEAIGFHSNFSLIFYFKSLNIMHTLTKQNNFIHRDEGYHAKFALQFMLKTGLNKLLTSEYIKNSINKFVELESKFLDSVASILNTKYKTGYTLKTLSIDGIKVYLKSLGNGISQLLCNSDIYDIDLNKIPSYILVAESSTIPNGIEINSNSYVKVNNITQEELLNLF